MASDEEHLSTIRARMKKTAWSDIQAADNAGKLMLREGS